VAAEEAMRKKADEEAAARKRAEEERERERMEEEAAQKVYTHMCISTHTCMDSFIRLSIPLC
jgi:hypothetical protein